MGSLASVELTLTNYALLKRYSAVIMRAHYRQLCCKLLPMFFGRLEVIGVFVSVRRGHGSTQVLKGVNQ